MNMAEENKPTATNNLEVKFDFLPKVNLAMQQNKIRIIRTLSISNKGEEDYANLSITITPDIPFAAAIQSTVESLPGGQTINVSGLDLVPDANYVLQLTERVNANLQLKISAGDQPLFCQQYPISILTFSEWTGTKIEPALTAAFVTPNHPALIPIIKRASEILKEWTNNNALDGYQSKNPDRVKKMAGALFESIMEQHITYSNPPASFEKEGQRIRLSDEVLSTKLGTCLDTTILYASCLEAIGLYPLVVLIHGHAFAGVWLESDTLPDNFNEDSALLSKHVGLNEIVLVETTMMTDGHKTDFDAACTTATTHIDDPSVFECVIDIARCRFAGIHPLPQRIQKEGIWAIDEKSQEESMHTEPKKVSKYDISTEEPKVMTKQDTWEHKLLDLSLRNALLNFRFSHKSMLLLSVSIDKMEDQLSTGAEFQILPRLKGMEAMELGGDTLGYKINAESDEGKLISKEIEQNRLYSCLDENDNKDVLKYLYRSSKVSIEENGANTLYMAIGMLRWLEPKVEKPHYAPILLLPIEMVRRGGGYIIRSRDEDTLLNVTLLELLRQNYQITVNGLDPLPLDNAGVDVPKILATMRQAILNQTGWDVQEVAVVGNFSFNKFIMWNDIHSNMEALRQNKIVDSLMTGKLQWQADADMTDAAELDRTVSPSEMALPVSSDSSQLEAVHAAAKGESFILHGPPGTGKSQTITNIIANALYQGKRVLFAAEKMAALSVVQNRLAKIGLAPFCLECHSNKARKSDVLSQLKEASDVTKIKTPDEFALDAQKLFDLRKGINGYVDALHKVYGCGLSLYQAITRYCQLQQSGEDKNDIEFPAEFISGLTKEQLDHYNEDIKELVIVCQSCGHPANHPLRHLNIKELTPTLQGDIDRLVKQNLKLLQDLQADLATAAKLCGASHIGTKEQVQALQLVAKALTSVSKLTPDLIKQPDIEQNSTSILTSLGHGLKAAQLSEDMLHNYTQGVLDLPAQSLKIKWQQAGLKWFLPRWLGQRSVKNQLAALSTTQQIQTEADLDKIIDYQQEKAAVGNNEWSTMPLFGSHATASAADWQEMMDMENCALSIHHALGNLTNEPIVMRQMKEQLAAQLSEGLGTLLQMKGAALKRIAETDSQMEQNDADLAAESGLTADVIDDQVTDGFIAARISELQKIDSNLDKLTDWYHYLLTEQKMAADSLQFVVDYFIQNNLPIGQWESSYLKGFYRSLAIYIFSQDKELTLFKGDIFEANIKRFRELNAQYQQLVQAELYAKLASNVPNFTIEAATSSEVGILQKNIHNNGRGLSLRALFDSIPTLLSRLAPCMLMSPMSVAQYLDVKNQPKFDLVIFDEASQMPTSEAVGAIARGENVIVVGDPKQMPPTSFFSSNNVDEENIELNDLESILDDCLALSIPSKHLLWHYRSKHESLIAFSNAQYYENKLLTFPSPDNRQSKVTFVKVDGHYDKGKSRQNKGEAQAVIDEVVRRLSDPELRKRSIGIVTFSIVQQSLIDDMLSDVFAQHPDLDAAANQCEEPLFIKNLENVQGDERDVILFSVGYGPDAEGHVSMNFGPLNQVGGERRLNVAVSRARYEMKVFSTLTADMIDMNRTDAEGVRGLKEFLDFAQKGTQALSQNDVAALQKKETISEVIAGDLRKRGYEVDTQIGCSGFRIDAAIVDPDDKGRYLLGLLCDGDSYREAKTARDREICQPAVLHALGWNILKVWTVDWWNNQETVLNAIDNAVKEAKERKAMPQPEPIAPKPKPIEVEKLASAPVNTDLSGGIHKIDYTAAQIEPNNEGLESMLNPLKGANVIHQMKEVISTEGPITRSLLFKRILSIWGVSRLSQRSEYSLSGLIDAFHPVSTKEGDSVVYWPAETKDYNTFRPSGDRDITDIPVEEVANAILFSLGQVLAAPAADLCKMAANQLGFTRVGINVDAATRQAMELLLKRRLVTEKDGKIAKA